MIDELLPTRERLEERVWNRVALDQPDPLSGNDTPPENGGCTLVTLSHWSCIARRSLLIVPFGAALRACHKSRLNFTVCSGLTTPQVVFAIIKVIIGPAILYLPHGFLQAGYGDTSAPQWRHAIQHQHVPHQHQPSRRTSQSLVLDFAVHSSLSLPLIANPHEDTEALQSSQCSVRRLCDLHDVAQLGNV